MTWKKEEIENWKSYHEERQQHIINSSTEDWFTGFVQEVETWSIEEINERMKITLIECWQEDKLGTFFQEKDLEDAEMKEKVFQAKDNIKSFQYFYNIFEINMCRMLLYMDSSSFALDPEICNYIQSLNACRILMKDYKESKYVEVLKVKFFDYDM